jgi:tetratricopeptide (TPR) repeat protein
MFGRLFWCDERRGEVGFGVPRADTKVRKMKLNKVNRLHVYAWPDHQEIFVNGHLNDEQHFEPFVMNGDLTIGWQDWADASGKLRLSNIQIRRIADASPASLSIAERRKHYAKIAAKNPTYPDPHLQMALILFADEAHTDWKGTLDAMTKAKELGSDSPKVSFVLGTCHRKLNQFKEALAEFAQGSSDPDMAMRCKLGTAEILLDCPDKSLRDPNKAYSLAKELLRDSFEGKDALMLMARVEAERGNCPLATEYAGKAMKLLVNKNEQKQWAVHLNAYKAGKKPE